MLMSKTFRTTIGDRHSEKCSALQKHSRGHSVWSKMNFQGLKLLRYEPRSIIWEKKNLISSILIDKCDVYLWKLWKKGR